VLSYLFFEKKQVFTEISDLAMRLNFISILCDVLAVSVATEINRNSSRKNNQ